MSNSNMDHGPTVLLSSLPEKYKWTSPNKTVQHIKKLYKIVLYPEVQKDIGKKKDFSLYTWKSMSF